MNVPIYVTLVIVLKNDAVVLVVDDAADLVRHTLPDDDVPALYVRVLRYEAIRLQLVVVVRLHRLDFWLRKEFFFAV